MAIDPDVEAELEKVRAVLAGHDAELQVLHAQGFNHRDRLIALEAGQVEPPEPEPPAPPPPSGKWPHELFTRYASATGRGAGLTYTDPMRLDDGFRWLDEQPGGSYLRIVDAKVDVTGEVYKFKNTRDPDGWRVVTTHGEATEFIYNGDGYLQAMFDVSGCSRIAFHGISSDGKARQGGGDLTPKGCMYFVTATSAPTANHHNWIKGGRHKNLDGAFTVYNNHKHPAAIGDFSIVEDIDAADIAHWGPWGGSAISVLAPVEAEITPDLALFQLGDQVFGQIWRNNTLRDVYQRHGYNNRITDGNAMILDYWNESDFWGATGKSDYDRGCLIEGNITAGCGRALSGVYANPKLGIWHRFNTHYLDGSTNTHALSGHRSIDVTPATLGGFGMYTPNFHSVANLVVLADGRHVTAGQTFDMGNYGTNWTDLWVMVQDRMPTKDDLGVCKDQMTWNALDGGIVLHRPWQTGDPLRDRLDRFRVQADMTTTAVRTGPDMLGNTSQLIGAIA